MNPTRFILDVLRRRHDQPRNGNSRAWVYVEEVRIGPGFSAHVGEMEMDNPIRIGREQRIDAFAFHTWPSYRLTRVAYEVKTSRADLRRELDLPSKCAAAVALSNEFYLVIPSSELLVGFETPPEWGIMIVKDGKEKIMRRAPWRDTPPPPYSFMLSVARTIQQHGERKLEVASSSMVG